MRFFSTLICSITALFSLQAASYEVIQNTSSLEILTPELKDVKMLKIRLPNDLQALIISSPHVHKSCAALAVSAGSWNDPDGYPGMAHFLEHMLFMGTKAYPGESEYQQFISDHAGSWNAYTAATRTVYGFSIQNDFLFAGLDRFSHFFIDPLFLQESVNRELIAVDQEHSKNIEHDGWRSYMVLKETANPNHPHTKFSTGNRKTLSNIPRKALKKWYEAQYSADRMHLVVIAPFPVEETAAHVADCFSPVINYRLPNPTYPFQLFSNQQKGHFLYIEPIKDTKELSLVWQLPKEVALDQDSHTPNLLAYALSYRGPGSLYDLLHQKSFIRTCHVSTDHFSSDCALLSIDFSLTDLGLQNLNLIIQDAFSVLASLKQTGISASIFEEYTKKAKLDYEYQSPTDPFETAMEIAGQMTHEPLQSYPDKTVLASVYNPQLMKVLLESLTPSECIYMVLAPSTLTGVKLSSYEKWMNVNYQLVPLDPNFLQTLNAAQISSNFKLSPPNPYFPSTLSTLTPTFQQKPGVIFDNEEGKVYYLQDSTYLLPQASVIFHIQSPFLDGSCFSEIVCDLHRKYVLENLKEHQDLAQRAGLEVQIHYKDLEYTVEISGYSEKLPLFCEQIFRTLSNPWISFIPFEDFKSRLLSAYSNLSKELPFRQALSHLPSLITQPHPTAQEKINMLKILSYEEFHQAASQLLRPSYVKGMIYGNLSPEEANCIVTSYQTQMKSSPFALHLHPKHTVFIPKNGPLMTLIPTSQQGYSALLCLYLAPFSLEARSVQSVLSMALKDDFFDTLRSKQQTGYIAAAFDTQIHEELFQLFTVQSSTHTPQELLYRFELFLEEFVRQMEQKIPLTRFETLKAAQLHHLATSAYNLSLKAHQLYQLAFRKNGDFDWIQKQMSTLQELSYDAFIQKSQQFLSRKNTHRLAILVEGIDPQDQALQYRLLEEKDFSADFEEVKKPE